MTPVCVENLPKIAVVGAFQSGKSTLVNCLLDGKYAPMGKGLRTTACCTYFLYGEAETVKLFHGDLQKSEVLDRREAIFGPDFTCGGTDFLEISCWKPILQKAVLIDTPGFDANGEDDTVAGKAIRKSDIIVFVHDAKQLDDCDLRILKDIREAGKRLLFLMNCNNRQNWHPDDEGNRRVSEAIEAQLSDIGFDAPLIRIQGRQVWAFNPVFAWYALGDLQRDLDSNLQNVRNDAEALTGDISAFCKKRKWEPSVQKERLLSGSGVLEIRRAIEDAAMAPLWELYTNRTAELQALTRKWSTRMKKIISDSEAVLRK